MNLMDEFQTLIAALNDADVAYALAGALALAVHGAPRATTDIDLLVPPDGVERVLKVVAPLGFTLPAEPMTFGASGITIQPVTKVAGGEALTLDLIAADPPLDVPWQGRVHLDAGLDGGAGMLWVVSREGLLRMKALAGRLQDLADIQRIEALAAEGTVSSGAITDAPSGEGGQGG